MLLLYVHASARGHSRPRTQRQMARVTPAMKKIVGKRWTRRIIGSKSYVVVVVEFAMLPTAMWADTGESGVRRDSQAKRA